MLPEFWIVILCSLPVPLSRAVTFRIPLASILKVTSIWGTPRGAGAIPSSTKRPRDLLSEAISRSPCKTWISTCGWLSAAVEKVSDFEVGIVVLRSISLVETPPIVSIPRESGVTSSKRTSFTSPWSTPPWIAAPTATTSSGLTPCIGSLPKSSLTFSTTAGIRVIPPTITTSLISLVESLASFRALWTGSARRSMSGETSSSIFERVKVYSKCFGPSASAERNGRLISVSLAEESSFLAFSASSLIRCMAAASFLTSIPDSSLNLSQRKLTMRLSKSSPPRWVSPFVESTSKTPSPNSRMETSKVPPPRSKTTIFSSLFFSRP